MFTVEERDAVRGRILGLAREDARVVAAAEVGSLAIGEGDEWSDLDLTFGVAEGERIEDVLGDFTRLLVERLAAAQLFDLPVGETIYRVFLLRSSLQVDLSFSPASSFGAHSRGSGSCSGRRSRSHISRRRTRGRRSAGPLTTQSARGSAWSAGCRCRRSS